jgi:excinuclease UvrABC helicase subunit UvrB
MNYNKEFNITPKQVKKEIRKIQQEMREYDDCGQVKKKEKKQ